MKQLRSERGITEEQVAKDLTVLFLSSAMSRTIVELSLIKSSSLLLKACNVSVDTILDAGRDIPPLDEKEHQLNDEVLNVFRGFSVSEKRKDHQDVTHLAGEIISCFFISCIAITHLHDLSSIYNIFHCMILYILITSINNL